MLKSSCLLSLLVLTGLNTMSCRESSGGHPNVSPKALRQSSLRFVNKTNLLGTSGGSSSGGSGGFQASTFPSTGFWPSTPLVVPARAAAFINENYGATGGFTYQSFEFTGTSCSASNAFGRYFSAIEQLRGTPLSAAEKQEIESAFQSAFSTGEVGLPVQSVCILYDLMACIADYAVLNESIFKQSAEEGDMTTVMTGVVSCIAEITGIDPPDTIDPFDPGSELPDE